MTDPGGINSQSNDVFTTRFSLTKMIIKRNRLATVGRALNAGLTAFPAKAAANWLPTVENWLPIKRILDFFEKTDHKVSNGNDLYHEGDFVKKNTNWPRGVVDHLFSQGYITPSQASLSN